MYVCGTHSVLLHTFSKSLALKFFQFVYVDRFLWQVLCNNNNNKCLITSSSLPHYSQVGYKSVLHIHTCVEECEVTKLIAEIDMKTKEQKKCKFVKQGGLCICRISVEKPICIEAFTVSCCSLPRIHCFLCLLKLTNVMQHGIIF